jgi:hypothetical protein
MTGPTGHNKKFRARVTRALILLSVAGAGLGSQAAIAAAKPAHMSPPGPGGPGGTITGHKVH